MAFAILHMEKIKASNFSGKFKHNSRDMKQTEKNQNVDFSVSHRNLSYGVVSLGDFTNYKKDHINPYIVRKDNVIVNELILTASADFFKDKNPEQVKQWWQDNLDFLKSRFGDNFIGASLHLDEKTPHIHANIVPLEKVLDKETNGYTYKLNGKKLFNREALKSLQDEYPAFMKSRGHDLERGEEEKAVKHTDQKTYSSITHNIMDMAKKNTKVLVGSLEKMLSKNVDKVLGERSINAITLLDTAKFKEEVKAEVVKASMVEIEPFLGRNLLRAYAAGKKKIDAEVVQEENVKLKDQNKILLEENERIVDLNNKAKDFIVQQKNLMEKKNSEIEKLKIEVQKYKPKDKSKGIGEW